MSSEIKTIHRRDRPRPLELSGWTWCISFEQQKLFVTVNHDGEEILEVFVTEMLSNGIGLLTSKMLQSGCFTAREVARSLGKIDSTHHVKFNGKIINSPVNLPISCH